MTSQSGLSRYKLSSNVKILGEKMESSMRSIGHFRWKHSFYFMCQLWLPQLYLQGNLSVATSSTLWAEIRLVLPDSRLSAQRLSSQPYRRCWLALFVCSWNIIVGKCCCGSACYTNLCGVWDAFMFLYGCISILIAYWRFCFSGLEIRTERCCAKKLQLGFWLGGLLAWYSQRQCGL